MKGMALEASRWSTPIAGANADALDAMPGLGIGVALKEIDVVARFVTGGRNAQGVQRAIGDRAFDAAEIKVASEQFA